MQAAPVILFVVQLAFLWWLAGHMVKLKKTDPELHAYLTRNMVKPADPRSPRGKAADDIAAPIIWTTSLFEKLKALSPRRHWSDLRSAVGNAKRNG